MLVVADRNIPALPETFGRHAEIRRCEGRELRRNDLRDANILLVRSVTRVDENLLSGTPVGFVGTATIGTDHLDIPWLEGRDPIFDEGLRVMKEVLDGTAGGERAY